MSAKSLFPVSWTGVNALSPGFIVTLLRGSLGPSMYYRIPAAPSKGFPHRVGRGQPAFVNLYRQLADELADTQRPLVPCPTLAHGHRPGSLLLVAVHEHVWDLLQLRLA